MNDMPVEDNGRTQGGGTAPDKYTRRLWYLIFAETVVFFILIYVTAIFEVPKHEYFRFLVLIPLYQAGVSFGFGGGLATGSIIALLFLPLMRVDRLIFEDAYGDEGIAAMIVFINIFGIFISGTIGRRRKTRRDVEGLSQASFRIARETNERGIMLRLAEEACVLTEVERAVVFIRNPDSFGSGRGVLLYIAQDGSEPEEAGEVPGEHPAVWCAENNEVIATNCIASDPRFSREGSEFAAQSILVVPVSSGSRVFGSLLLLEKRGGALFTENDLSIARLLAGAAGAVAGNVGQERKRQEEELRAEQMKSLFSRFVSESVAEHVLENPDLLKGRWQEVTVLVSDIRGFTRLSESLPPQELVSQLNEYFTRMVDIVMEKNGTIDKFMGDCMVAYWGALAPDADHPVHAAEAAAGMARALAELNEKWKSGGRPDFRTGISLHTCSVLMGNMGDERKKVFSILGEGVDRAIEIESLTDKFGEKIITTGTTAERISGKFELEKLASHEGEELFGLKI
ncbi:adenylate/guanylate cyclase domain-containing protein [bacterium]